MGNALKIFAFFLACATRCLATQFFVTQSGAGSNNGTSLGNAWSVATFNSSETAGAGDTVSVSGAITTALVPRSGGSSGNPVTVSISGADFTSSAWASSGAIVLDNLSNVTLDGGSTGVIENTANGTGLANQVNSTGVSCGQAANIIVQNLTVRNLYVRTLISDTTGAGTGVFTFWSGGTAATNVAVTNCIFHDMENGAYFDYGPSASGYTVSFCTAYNCNWGGGCGDHGNTSTMTGLSVHDNNFYSWANWNEASPSLYHHNGFYAFAESGGSIANVSIYNNMVGPGYSGNGQTAGIFVSGNISNVSVYNNRFLAMGSDNWADGMVFLWQHNGAGTNISAYNNTFVCSATVTVPAINIFAGTATYTVENNLFSGCPCAIYRYNNTSSTLVSKNNLFFGLSGSLAFSDSATGSSTGLSLAQWQSLSYLPDPTFTGQTSNPLLNSAFTPASGSPARAAGTPLASVTLDASGHARPALPSIGAYEWYVSGLSALANGGAVVLQGP